MTPAAHDGPDRSPGPARLLTSRLFWMGSSFALVVLFTVTRGLLHGDEDPSAAQAADQPIVVSADYALQWTQGDEDVAVLRGNCRIVSNGTTLSAHEMVVWRQRSSGLRTGERLVVYLEDDARIDRAGRTESGNTLFTELTAPAGSHWQIRHATSVASTNDPLYRRAVARRPIASRGHVQLTQMQVPLETVPVQPPPRQQQQQMRRIRIFPRSSVPYNVRSFQSEDTTPPEQVWVVTGGVNVIVEGVQPYGTVDLSADRVVIWTRGGENGEFAADTVQPQDVPFQVYLEGNIVIRQEENVLRSSHAFYDAQTDQGLMLNAELKTPIPTLGADVRVRAQRIRQFSKDSFHGRDAWLTASEYGKPGYRLQASDVFLENRYVTPWVNGTDPATGAPVVERVPWVTALNNTFLVEDVPLLYTPYVSTPAEDPGIPLRRASVGNDDILGTQVETAWDSFKLFGISRPRGVDWELLLNGYTDRGPGAGTAGSYRGGTDVFGLPTDYVGDGLIYYQRDTDLDDLGGFRRNVPIETDDRYRARLRHQQRFPGQLAVFGEIGILSDRNFLEQYYEQEFDTAKDNEQLLYARQLLDNWAWTGLVRTRANDFTNTTDWLPRGDLYTLSEPLFGGRLTWSQHSYAGYGRLRPGDPATDPVLGPRFTPLPFVANAEGAVLMTRHEIDAPLHLGPVNVTPYAWGEAAHWDEDLAGNDVDRLVGTAGVRGSLLVWRVFPHVQSRLFNLSGLAHKMRFEAGYSYTDSSRDLASIPQYNEFDENAQERYRQLFVDTSFGGTLPAVAEPRFYAVRSGAGASVTAPYHELVDDQQVARLAWRHRLQTKVGPPGNTRIRDWMTLDIEGAYFPDPDRDNFGEDLGLVGGRYVWQFSDRTRFLASTTQDFFDLGQRVWSIGMTSQRSRRGSVYVGYEQTEIGPVDSQIVSASLSYRMSPKWISTLSTSYDVGFSQNLGQSVTVTRIGKDFLTHFGVNWVDTKDNFGVSFLVQPKLGAVQNAFMRLGSLSNLSGRQ